MGADALWSKRLTLAPGLLQIFSSKKRIIFVASQEFQMQGSQPLISSDWRTLAVLQLFPNLDMLLFTNASATRKATNVVTYSIGRSWKATDECVKFLH